MAAAKNRVPPGMHTISPHLTCRNAASMIEFYKKAFGAVENRRAPSPDGKDVLHAEMRIGDSIFFLNDEFPSMNAHSPLKYNGTGVVIHLQVEDVDKLWTQATAAGAKVIMPLADQFWGDRYGTVEDPSGHHWSMASHMEDLTQDEIKKKMEAMMGKQ